MKKELIIIVISISICALIIGAIFYSNNNNISYGILIIDGDIPVGDNITLVYEIKNGMFAPSVSDVNLDIWVFDLRDTNFQEGLLHYVIPIHDLNSEQITDQVVISAHYLDPGKYVIRTRLTYTTDQSYLGKQLEMEFEIY